MKFVIDILKVRLLIFILILCACNSVKKVLKPNSETHTVETNRIYSVNVSLELKKRTILFDLSKEDQESKGFRKIEIETNNNYKDHVIVTENDKFISKFKSENYFISDRKIVIYYADGQPSSIEELSDSLSISNENLTTYYRFFKALKQGKSLYYWPNGNLAQLTFFRNGQNDTFSMSWYSNKNLYSYSHKDTLIYFSESGDTAQKEFYKYVGKDKFYAQLLYWPNGKLKSESFFTSKMRGVPCHTWVNYNEKGKVIGTVKHKPENQPVEDWPAPRVLDIIQVPNCNFKQNIKTGLEGILKNKKLDYRGFNKIGINVTNGSVSLSWISGHAASGLEESIEKSIQNWYCSNDDGASRRGGFGYVSITDDYNIFFEVIEEK